MQLLHSTILGKGQPFLILHGYFGMSDNWKTLGNQFSENYQVHLIDQRNHGEVFIRMILIMNFYRKIYMLIFNIIN